MTEEILQQNLGQVNKEEEYLNNWKRAAADLANYKKEEMERMGTLLQYSKADLIEKVLPIFDSIYLSAKSFNSVQDEHSNILENVGMSEWMKGFEQIKKQIEEFLKKEGIEEIKVVGEKFNPETMEAVGEAEDGDKGTSGESGMVAEELQKGYMMGGKVLRVARVKVNK